jgi:hypothetical protein
MEPLCNMRLLQVEDVFDLSGRGLVVVPLLPFPDRRAYKPFRDNVRIERPDGTTITVEATFNPEHFLLAGGRGRMNIVVGFGKMAKSDIPVGSAVFVTATTMAALAGTADGGG